MRMRKKKQRLRTHTHTPFAAKTFRLHNDDLIGDETSTNNGFCLRVRLCVCVYVQTHAQDAYTGHQRRVHNIMVIRQLDTTDVPT